LTANKKTLSGNGDTFLRHIIDASPDIIAVRDADGRIILANAKYAGFFGMSPSQLEGKRVKELSIQTGWSQPLVEKWLAEDRQVISNGQPLLALENVTHKNGETRKYRTLKQRIEGESGEKLVLMLSVDLTDVIKTESELIESERLYHSLFTHMLNGFAYCRMVYENGVPEDFVYLAVNDAFEKLTGLKNVVGKRVTEVIPGIRETDPELFEIYGRVASSGVPEVFETYVKSLDMWFAVSVYSPQKEHFVAIFDVITERKRAERLLIESGEKFKSIISSSSDAILSCKDDMTIELCNSAAEKIFGYAENELIGKSLAELLPIRYRGRLEEQFKRLPEFGKQAFSKKPVEIEGINKDGTEFAIELSLTHRRSGEKDFATAVVRDVTGRKLLENQLLQSQTLEAIGQLAGGIAHDFNNLLTGILGFAELAMANLDPASQVFTDLEEIRSAAQRAADLTSRILAFSRRQILDPVDLDLNNLLESTTKLLKRVIGENIELEVIFGHRLGKIHADPSQVEQVVLNLATNARDAMPNGGRLTIETENIVINGVYNESHPWSPPGRYVLMTVSDSGFGMSREVMEHVFEPFFTTKEVGKGTGLGLASVHGIVSQHNGFVHIYSEEGKGTTVKVYFPIVERSASSVGTKIEEQIRGGNETVLVAEDEKLLQNMAVRLLTNKGYKVLTAANGLEAVRIYQENADKIDLVILDVVMPGIGGPDALDRIRGIKPQVRALLASGYSAETPQIRLARELGVEMLAKPYNPDLLLRKVREALDKPPCEQQND
jgi:PAS domain S-box-containing protein